MKLTIASPKGLVEKTEIDYIVTCGENGQFAILKNHTPVVVPVKTGWIKTVTSGEESFYIVTGAIVEFKEDNLNIIVQEIAKGNSLEKAKEAYLEFKKTQKSENTRKLMDFTELEKELAKNLKEIKAAHIE